MAEQYQNKLFGVPPLTRISADPVRLRIVESKGPNVKVEVVSHPYNVPPFVRDGKTSPRTMPLGALKGMDKISGVDYSCTADQFEASIEHAGRTLMAERRKRDPLGIADLLIPDFPEVEMPRDNWPSSLPQLSHGEDPKYKAEEKQRK